MSTFSPLLCIILVTCFSFLLWFIWYPGIVTFIFMFDIEKYYVHHYIFNVHNVCHIGIFLTEINIDYILKSLHTQFPTNTLSFTYPALHITLYKHLLFPKDFYFPPVGSALTIDEIYLKVISYMHTARQAATQTLLLTTGAVWACLKSL